MSKGIISFRCIGMIHGETHVVAWEEDKENGKIGIGQSTDDAINDYLLRTYGTLSDKAKFELRSLELKTVLAD